MTQSLDVHIQGDVLLPGKKAAVGKGQFGFMNRKTGAETARNGHSFPAIIENMIAGAKEGREAAALTAARKTVGKGAGSIIGTPGEGHTLIKHGSAKDAGTDAVLKNGMVSSKLTSSAKGPKRVHGQKDDEPLSLETPVLFVQGQTPSDVLKMPVDAENRKMQDAKDSAESSVVAKKTVRSGSAGSSSDSGISSGLERLLAGSSKASAPDSKASGSVEQGQRAERKDRKTLIGVRDDRKEKNVEAPTDSPFVKTTAIKEANTADMTIGFRNAENGSQSLAGENNRLTEKHDVDGKNFASMLSQELKNNAADFVKTGHIVLKDNNAGLIRLTLNPESLGNVKISLELSGDKKISGKIVVSSQEAYDAFNENLEGLSQAFVDGGFQGAGFDLSWSGQESGSRQKEAEAAVVAPFYASAVPDVMSGRERADTLNSGYRPLSSSAINVFA